MTQVKEMTNPELNRKLAELMGWTIRHYKYTDSYVLVTPQGKTGSREGTKVEAWSDGPDYCTDPAASLEVQEAAIARDKDDYLNNLTGVVAGYYPKSINWDIEWENDVIALLLTASPRERAEAAYQTLQEES
ncbi:hypothetical protein [Paenibacillus typhae]|uniref:hypothetical protein n=1 Tax=Paenibacillus typhae TaxID=1174501 RepID=UPI001C8D63DC|nr:hypothetical protein [Paenibacillus typhae]MBY0011478.1 hypothetical protein [Paenibacillus typhae]